MGALLFSELAGSGLGYVSDEQWSRMPVPERARLLSKAGYTSSEVYNLVLKQRAPLLFEDKGAYLSPRRFGMALQKRSRSIEEIEADLARIRAEQASAHEAVTRYRVPTRYRPRSETATEVIKRLAMGREEPFPRVRPELDWARAKRIPSSDVQRRAWEAEKSRVKKIAGEVGVRALERKRQEAWRRQLLQERERATGRRTLLTQAEAERIRGTQKKVDRIAALTTRSAAWGRMSEAQRLAYLKRIHATNASERQRLDKAIAWYRKRVERDARLRELTGGAAPIGEEQAAREKREWQASVARTKAGKALAAKRKAAELAKRRAATQVPPGATVRPGGVLSFGPQVSDRPWIDPRIQQAVPSAQATQARSGQAYGTPASTGYTTYYTDTRI